MATPSTNVKSSSSRPFSLVERVKPYLIPYYITLAAVLGAATTGFLVIIALLILVVSNFNVLGLIE
jgi:hypothetical protein